MPLDELQVIYAAFAHEYEDLQQLTIGSKGRPRYRAAAPDPTR